MSRLSVFFVLLECLIDTTQCSLRFVNVMEEKHCERGIMLYKKKLTPSAKKTITELQSDYKIEDYAEADLVVNITKHFLVPKHTIMTNEEKKELLHR